MANLKKRLGCWLRERWRMELVLRAPLLARRAGLEWQDLCNRHERLSRCDDLGRVCLWQDSSFLTACRIFPRLGGRLLEHVLSEHPFSIESAPSAGPVSAIIPVRGTDRSKVLSFVASALRAVCGPGSEVLVCEHDVAPHYRRAWPEGVRHVFIPATEGEAFNKSKALNAGALAARHPMLLLHDADVWPPSDYVSQCVERMDREGWDAVRPIRFLFLLDESQTQACMQTGDIRGVRNIPYVQQNNPGLSSFVRRDTYMDLGGHDERFSGWGWEDMEFLDRLQSRKLNPGSFLPAVHLWHAAAPEKMKGNLNVDLLRRILQEPMAQRIERGRRQLEGRRP
jgi:hypothetical protein